MVALGRVVWKRTYGPQENMRKLLLTCPVKVKNLYPEHENGESGCHSSISLSPIRKQPYILWKNLTFLPEKGYHVAKTT